MPENMNGGHMEDGCRCELCQRRHARQRQEIEAGNLALYVLSFVDNGTLRGACVIRGFGPADAFDQAMKRKLEDRFTDVVVMGVPADHEVPDDYLGRILTEVEFGLLGMGTVDLRTGQRPDDPKRAKA